MSRLIRLSVPLLVLGMSLSPPVQAANWRGRMSAMGRTTAAAAHDFVATHKRALRLDAQDDAQPVAQHETPSGAYVRLERYRGGLRVDGGTVAVHVGPGGELDSAHTRDLAPFTGSLTPTVAPADADAIAHKTSGLGPRGQTQINDLILFTVDRHPKLAWDVWVFAKHPTSRWRVVVDAQTKKVLFAEDMVRRVVGTGDVFNPSPTVVLQDANLTDQSDTDAAVPAGAYSTVNLQDLDPADGGGFYHLDGPYVRSVELEDPVITPPAETMPAFTYTRHDDNFEWVMAYYHIDAIQRYFQSLGFTTINNRQIEVDAHGVDGDDNSHYASDGFGTGYLAMGDGGVDDAEDAEVLAHEYGHSVHDNQCPNCYAGHEADSMGEGWGDFLAATYFADVSGGFGDACFADWDSDDPCLRRLDTTKHYPEDMEGEVHSDGEIWSATLWDFLLAVSGSPTPTLAARDIALSVALESHFLVPERPSFFEGAQALLDAEQALYGGTYHADLLAILQARGLVSACGAAPEPAANCFLQTAPLKASILIKHDDFNDAKDKLVWSWKSGVATNLADLGNPVTTTPRYELCIYDGSGNAQPMTDALILGGSTCDGQPCWKASGTTGFKFKNKTGIGSQGITGIALKAGIAGRSQVKVTGKKTYLDAPNPALTVPVTVQLLVNDGTQRCWQTQFSTATKNDDQQFKAKGP